MTGVLAAAEAQELKAALTVAAAWGDVEAERIAAVLALAERLGAMTYRLAQ